LLHRFKNKRKKEIKNQAIGYSNIEKEMVVNNMNISQCYKTWQTLKYPMQRPVQIVDYLHHQQEGMGM